MVNIIEMFINELPYSLLVFVIPIIAFFLLKPKGIEQKLDDYVEVWFKGYSKAKFKAVVNNDMIQFQIEDEEFTEPILTYPRMELYRGKFIRVYHFAEGLTGTIEASEATPDIKMEILNILLENGLIDAERKEELIKNDEEFLKEIRFYNFDIDQGDIHAIQRTFNASVNTFPKLINDLAKGIKNPNEMTTFKLFLLGLLCGIAGFFIGYSLTLKGVI